MSQIHTIQGSRDWLVVAGASVCLIIMGICWSLCDSSDGGIGRGGGGNDGTSSWETQGPRYTVVVSSTYTNDNGREVTDTQEMQFGSESAAQAYAKQWVGQLGVQVEIRGPPLRA